MTLDRRRLIAAMLAAPAMPLIVRGAAAAPKLEPTPACGAADATIPQTAGPYFTPSTPLKRDFYLDSPAGERMTLGGFVVDRNCKPVSGALIELWHADEAGDYDNQGYRLRGHQFTDEAGRWWFDTIRPGLYPGRTRHFHVKVQPPGGKVLTTQFYFPDDMLNGWDGIFDKSLILTMGEADGRPFGRYDVVVET